MKTDAGDHQEKTWEHIQSHLDHCLQELNASDRETLLLRYFKESNLKDVGQALGVSEDAAQKRVRRALDKLKILLGRQGVALSATSLATLMSAHSVTAAPLGLAAQVTSATLATAGAGTGLGWLATQLKMPLTLMKTPYMLTSAAVIGIGTPLMYQYYSIHTLKAEQRDVRAQLEELGDVPGAYQDWLRTRGEILALEKLQQELEDKPRLEAQVASLKSDGAERKRAQLARLNEAQAQLQDAASKKEETIRNIEFRDHQIKVINVMKHMGLAARIYANEHGDLLPTDMEQIDWESYLKPELTEEVPLEGFEYHRHERKLFETEPRMILFREVTSRFDGEQYFRAYTFVDGSVQIHASETDDFSEWEAQHTATMDNLPPDMAERMEQEKRASR